MKFTVRFQIGNRLGAASRYTLKDFVTSIVDRYSLTESELCTIVALQPDDVFRNNDMEVRRVA